MRQLRNTLATVLLLHAMGSMAIGQIVEPASADRPNILWLSTEDIGPELNCYGDSTAKTPVLDQLAQRGTVYRYAWSNYPVCAPARTTIITGMYASTCGAGNMRSHIQLPEGVKLFPSYLKQAGYYCTNNSKTDYNYRDIQHQPWDESSRKAHYRNRKPGQPFFAVFNYTGTHESKIRQRPHQADVDPATVSVKSYWPDTPEVRTDLAQYYDNLQSMDRWLGKRLQELKDAGEAENTIVLFFGDHGSGMPRHKRYAGDSGMRVPLVIHVPEKWQHLAGSDYQSGTTSKRLVGFVDLAPTMLSLTGVEPADYMQGHAFAGKFQTPGPDYLYGFRDRMDERPDVSRSIRDRNFLYIRNYFPQLPAGQHIDYQLQTPTTRVWKQRFEGGQLNEVQSRFWKPRAVEELYDLRTDPEETINLAAQPDYQPTLQRFRDQHRKSYLQWGDLGLIPESTLLEIDQSGVSPRTVLRNSVSFPLEKIFDAADNATRVTAETLDGLQPLLTDPNPTIQYWGLVGCQIAGHPAVDHWSNLVLAAVDSPNAAVAIVASELVAKFGEPSARQAALQRLVHFSDYRNGNLMAAVAALNAIERLGDQASSVHEDLQSIPQFDPKLPRAKSYLTRLLESIGIANQQLP